MANSSNYKASATEFCKRMTALYKLKIFPRMGSEFADKLYKSGVEAGAHILALGDLGDAENKLKVGCDAIVKLNEVAFAMQLMVEGGFYTADETAPLCAYTEKLIEAISKLIASIKERQAAHRAAMEKSQAYRNGVVVRSSAEIFKEAQEEAKKLQDEQNYDEGDESAAADSDSDDFSGGDGFSEPYKGKIVPSNKKNNKQRK